MPHSFEISLSNGQSRHAVDEEQLIAAARAVLLESEFSSAMISLAVVDDETMHELNRQFLNHDYPTDVLSFALARRRQPLGRRSDYQCRYGRRYRGRTGLHRRRPSSCCTLFTECCTWSDFATKHRRRPRKCASPKRSSWANLAGMPHFAAGAATTRADAADMRKLTRRSRHAVIANALFLALARQFR